MTDATHSAVASVVNAITKLTPTSQRMQIPSEVLGCTVSFVEVLQEAGTASMVQMCMPPSLVEWLTSLNALIAAGYAGAISTNVQNLLGRSAIGLRQFAHDYQGARK